MPLSWISSFTLAANDDTIKQNTVTTLSEGKLGTFAYRVNVSVLSDGEGYIKLSQGYDKGWIAISGGKVLEHLRANGWSNAWKTPATQGNITVYVVYLPQFLEYIGFALLLIVVIKFCQPYWR